MRKLNLWAILLMAVVAFASCGQAPEAKKHVQIAVQCLRGLQEHLCGCAVRADSLP